ncbi:hypothetical protein [Micromonospora chokoriensis]|uniref:hypothetical protein n=1 Tax=Micromonospora chokoriensis TaxID=356851 RepID=UPI0004C3B2B2|nr:hypothetical protein [Micromonospora chokoriensis]
MAFRTWGRLLLTALGVSVLAGAGQLGVAYGFGIVRLTGAFTGTTVNQWPAQLVWVGWFAANAAVAGAVLTGRLAHRDAPAASTGRQLAIGGAAALGATVIAPLCMQPARAAELISVDPVWAVGICAVVGAVIGAGAAIAVLLRPELGWNMAAVAGVVWLLALISVLPSLGTVGPLPTVRLGVLEPSWLNDAAAQRLALLLLPTVALLAGAATAGLARWRGQNPLVSGATGVAGPVLVAFAYLTAGPGDAVDRYQAAPYYGSLMAILAGALGAAAAALLRWPTGLRSGDPRAIEPSAILGPLPAGPALPQTASTIPVNDPDTAERTDAAPATDATAGGVVAGPWAAGSPDAVRTVPAHWDWPETTASGQHGPTPAAPATPAAWLTAPTGEFTAAGQTPSASLDDAPATTDTTPTGRADAATPTGDRAVDEPTGTQTGGRSTPQETAGPSTDTTSNSDATTAASSAPTGTGSTTDKTVAATSASPADPGTADAPSTLKPRRSRKPKATPDTTASTSADYTSPADPATTATAASDPAANDPAANATTATAATVASETATTATATGQTAVGRTAKGSRAGSSADSAGSDAATDTQVPSQQSVSAEATSGTAAAGAKRTPATPSAGSKPASATSASRAGGAKATGAAGTGSKAALPDATSPISDSAIDEARNTDSARPAAEDVPTAGLFGASTPSPDADLWTPAPSAWPVTPTWTVPPQASEPAATTSETPDGSAESTGQTPRSRHRAPLPDLSRVGTWNAFDTSRRALSKGSQDSSTAPTTTSESTTQVERPGSTESAGPVGAPSGSASDATSTGDATSGTGDSGQTDGAPMPPKVAEQPSRRGRLGGLFRRNRSRAEEESPKASDVTEPLATQDEEFVDWVAGLSKPVSDNEPEQENGRRSLRSSGRHHRD